MSIYAPTFGDVEDAVIIKLNDALAFEIGDTVPKVTASMLPFGLVSRSGGPRNGIVTEAATLLAESYASSWHQANANAQLMRRELFAMAGGRRFPDRDGNMITVYRVDEFAGPARLPDPQSGFPRFVFTVSMTVRSLNT